MTELAKREGFFEDLFDFRKDMDELFHRMVNRSPWVARPVGQWLREVPPVEAWVDKDGKNFHARIALPGIDPQNVQLNVQNGTLSISAERKETRESKDVNYLRREFTYGSLERTLTLPEGVEVDKITAESNNGVLEISAPIAAGALPRRIEIKAAKSKSAGA
jgi:HSP20 family protein